MILNKVIVGISYYTRRYRVWATGVVLGVDVIFSEFSCIFNMFEFIRLCNEIFRILETK